MIMQEIVDTENDYLSNLMTLNLVYMRPIKALLEENPKIVGDKLRICLLSIRSDLEVILGIQKQFMSEISRRTKEWNDKTKLADIFLLFSDPLKTYFSYMNHYQTVIPLLSQTHGSEFAAKLELMKKPSCGGKGLRDFLIMPAQRIPRYLMLLIDLLKKTPPDHPDYENLIEAKKKYSELSDKVDEDLADFKSLETVMKYSSTLTFSKKFKAFPLVEPHRRFVSEVEVTFFEGSPEDNLTTKAGSLIIFNDLILLCRNSRKHKQKTVLKVLRIEGLFFTAKVVGEKEALYVQYDGSALFLFPNHNENLLGMLTEVREQKNHGKKSNTATVPVLKCTHTEPTRRRRRTISKPGLSSPSADVTSVEPPTSALPRSRSSSALSKSDLDIIIQPPDLNFTDGPKIFSARGRAFSEARPRKQSITTPKPDAL